MHLANVTPAELQRRLAAVGMTISLAYISHLMRGRRSLSTNPVMRRHIADALGVERDWIEQLEPVVSPRPVERREKRIYSQRQRSEAVARARAVGTPRAARELGIPRTTVATWVAQQETKR